MQCSLKALVLAEIPQTFSLDCNARHSLFLLQALPIHYRYFFNIEFPIKLKSLVLKLMSRLYFFLFVAPEKLRFVVLWFDS